jgi:hypothetical protein
MCLKLLLGTCLFGRAYSDTPKGDLNGDGKVTGPSEVVVENSFTFPYGTTESFPDMKDSNLNTASNSAHGYMECSNVVISI